MTVRPVAAAAAGALVPPLFWAVSRPACEVVAGLVTQPAPLAVLGMALPVLVWRLRSRSFAWFLWTFALSAVGGWLTCTPDGAGRLANEWASEALWGLGFVFTALPVALYCACYRARAQGRVDPWPGLFLMEFAAALGILAVLIAASLAAPAPLGDPADLGHTPRLARAPWFVVFIQELLMYFDPGIVAAVLVPGGLCAIAALPWLSSDERRPGRGAVSLTMAALGLLGVLTVTPYLFRGPERLAFPAFGELLSLTPKEGLAAAQQIGFLLGAPGPHPAWDAVVPAAWFLAFGIVGAVLTGRRIGRGRGVLAGLAAGILFAVPAKICLASLAALAGGGS